MNTQAVYDQLIALSGRVFQSRLEAADTVTAIFNEHMAVLTHGGKTGYVQWAREPKHGEKPSEQPRVHYMSASDTTTLFEPCVVAYRNGKNIDIASAFRLWKGHPGRRTCHGLIFDATLADDNDSILNLYFGPGVAPADTQEDGGWDLLWELMLNGICGNEPDPEEAANDLLSFLAWKLQNPCRQPEKALVLRGGKGTGKNTLLDIFGYVLGPAYYQMVTSREHAFNRFNAHLLNCALLVLNEAWWRGDKREEGILKGLVTDPILPVEIKFGPMVMADNHLMVALLANADWVVPASLDERRFHVLDVTDAYRNNTGFFGRLRAQMVAGGYAAFARYLLDMDLDRWHPRQLNGTRGLKRQKALSLEPHLQWLAALVEDPIGVPDVYGASLTPKVHPDHKGPAPACIWEHWEDNPIFAGTREQLHAAYRDWTRTHCSHYRSGELLSPRGLTNALTKDTGRLVYPSQRHIDRKKVRGWFFRSRKELQKCLQQHIETEDN